MQLSYSLSRYDNLSQHRWCTFCSTDDDIVGIATAFPSFADVSLSTYVPPVHAEAPSPPSLPPHSLQEFGYMEIHVIRQTSRGVNGDERHGPALALPRCQLMKGGGMDPRLSIFSHEMPHDFRVSRGFG